MKLFSRDARRWRGFRDFGRLAGEDRKFSERRRELHLNKEMNQAYTEYNETLWCMIGL